MADVHFIDGQALAPTAFGDLTPRLGCGIPLNSLEATEPTVSGLDFDPDAGFVYSDAVQNSNNAATNLFDGSLSSYTGSTDGTAMGGLAM